MKLVELTREEIAKMRAIDERSTAIGLSRETYFTLLDAAESYVSRKSLRGLETAIALAGDEIIALRRRVLELEREAASPARTSALICEGCGKPIVPGKLHRCSRGWK